MNRPNFTELVVALKRRLSKGVGFKLVKLGNFDRVRNQKVVDVLACKNGGLPSCCQSWATLGHGTCLILFERLCFHIVEDSEGRGREDPWLRMGIL
jgi:hypothetical protein